MKKITFWLILLIMAVFAVGCTTAVYGNKPFTPTGPNEYIFKVHTGGFAGKGTATLRAIKEIDKFMEKNGYKTYKIVSSHYEFFPIAGAVFDVEFSK